MKLELESVDGGDELPLVLDIPVLLALVLTPGPLLEETATPVELELVKLISVDDEIGACSVEDVDDEIKLDELTSIGLEVDGVPALGGLKIAEELDELVTDDDGIGVCSLEVMGALEVLAGFSEPEGEGRLELETDPEAETVGEELIIAEIELVLPPEFLSLLDTVGSTELDGVT